MRFDKLASVASFSWSASRLSCLEFGFNDDICPIDWYDQFHLFGR
jgi:hypothetical protein